MTGQNARVGPDLAKGACVQLPEATVQNGAELLTDQSPDAVELLELAAVVGDRFTVDDLAILTGRTATSLWTTLREPLNDGLVADDADGLTFADPCLRTALYQRVPASVRRALHRDLARALIAAGTPAADVTEHLRRGAQRGDREAVRWLISAARDVAGSDPAAAVELFESASSLDDRRPAERVDAELDLARALVECGRLADAEQRCRHALDDVPGSPFEGALRLCLTDSLMRQGRLEEVHEEATRAAAAPDLSPPDRARVLAWAVFGPLYAHDLDRLAAAAGAVRAAAEDAGDVAALVMADVTLGHRATFAGRFLEAEGSHRRAAERAAREDTQLAHLAVPHLGLSGALVACDRLDDARRAVATGRRAYVRLGVTPALRIADIYAAEIEFWAGEWDAALAGFGSATTAATPDDQGWQIDALVTSAAMHVRRGAVEAAQRALDRIDEQRAAGAVGWKLGWQEWVRALVAEARGSGLAVEALHAAWDTAVAAPMRSELRALAPDLLRALAAAQAGSGLSAVAGELSGLAAANPGVVSCSALAGLAAALAAGDADGLGRASLAHRAIAPSVQRGFAAESAAVALAADGRHDEARVHAADAHATYNHLAAVGDLDRLRQRLRGVGLSVGVRGGDGARAGGARPGHGRLTPAELRVVGLVAEGLTNPEIAARLVVSRHTVATHVSHALAKLGLRTRTELAREIVRGTVDGVGPGRGGAPEHRSS